VAGHAQALEHTAHGGHADAPTLGLGNTGAPLLSGERDVVVPQPPDQCGGGRIQARPLAAGMRFGREVARRAVTAYECLDTREADAEAVRESALGAEPALLLPAPHAVHSWPGSSSDSRRCPFIVLRHMWHTRWALNKLLNALTMPGWNVHCPSYGKAVSLRR
jgi:hypothetical protein